MSLHRTISLLALIALVTAACTPGARETPADRGRRSGAITLIETSYDDAGIDIEALGAALGYRIERFASSGTHPAWCYAVLYRQVLRGRIPDCCIITGDMNAMTLPGSTISDDVAGDFARTAGFPAVMDTISSIIASAGPTASRGDFNARLGASFLPRIIALARGHGVVPVFAQVRTLADAENPLADPATDQRERDKLAAYLEKSGAIFLDYSRDPEIEAADFLDAGHLSARGTRKWNAQLRLDLGNIRDGKPALHEYHVRPSTVKIRQPATGARLDAGRDVLLTADGDRLIKWSCFIPGSPDGEIFLGTGRRLTARIKPFDRQEHSAWIFAYDGYTRDRVACVIVSDGTGASDGEDTRTE